MKTFTFAFITTLIAVSATAQNGSITGTVADAAKGPLSSATVTLHAADSSVLKRTAAGTSGDFRFGGIASGRYFVSVSAVGHNAAWSAPVNITADALTASVPHFLLTPSSQTMAAVTVVSRRPLVEQKADRTVINVDASPTNAGATALEVLEKSPGVLVDKDGNVSLKGKPGVQVFIDGRPSYLSGAELSAYLRSLPAGSIDQIELMTNPGARYDAAGNAGIINLRMKKNRVKGFNGSISLAATHAMRNRANNNANFNYRRGKMNLFSNVSHSHYERYQNLDIQRYFRENGSIRNTFEQQTRQRSQNDYVSARLGADFFASKRTTLGIVFSGGTNPETGTSTSVSYIRNAARDVDSIVSAESLMTNTWRNGAVNLNLRHQFDSTGKEITADADLVTYRTGADQLFDNNAYDPHWVKRSGEQLRGNLPVTIRIYSVKSDYSQPLKGGARFEAGVKASYVRTDNSADYYTVLAAGDQVDAGKTNAFRYEEQILAGYVNWNRQWKKWNLQTGLRYEHTDYTGLQYGSPDQAAHPDSSFRRDYGSLFPTLFASYAANAKHTFNVSYGRRIDRPSYQSLNPFLFFIDRYTYEQGNPYMRPEFSDNIELGHNYKNIITTTLAYSDTRNLMNETFEQERNANGSLGLATIIKNGNFGRRQNMGLSVNVQVPVRKWWNANLFSNYVNVRFSGRMNGDGEEFNASTSLVMFNASNQFVLGKGWSAELSGWYRSRGVDGQIVISPMGQVSTGVSKAIFKGAGSIKCNVRDVFFTQKVNGEINFQNTQAFFQQRRDTRSVTLAFSWRFGKPIKDTPRRRAGAASDELNRVKGAN
ncbi:MAG: TonB-dependent receptor [Chitinophagaceae bacterium]|nr:MAG: TonB-dependent receptor [Chitinophagaceae bacterium]